MSCRPRASGLASASVGPFFLYPQTQRANLLFLCSDQHQTAASGCYSHREVRTPHIDEIAADGVRFERTYCQSPVCVPSRGSIVTGVYPHSHGARILQDPLPADARTVAHFFKDHGYVTAAIGKMHFVDETRRHGFDHRLHNRDFLNRLTKSEQEALRKDQRAPDVAGRPSLLPARYFRDTYYSEETVKFLRENRGRPFCLWSSFYMPHTPLVPMKEFFDLYDPEKLTLPKRSDRELQGGFEGHLIRAKERGWYQQTDEQLRRSMAGYYGNISQMDSNIGRVFDTLRELGLDKKYRSRLHVRPRRDGGRSPHVDQAQHVRAVGQRAAHRENARSHRGGRFAAGDHRTGRPVSTMAELCGLGTPPGIHGRGFAALVRNQAFEQREFAYSEYYFCRRVFTRDDRYVGKPPILMVRTDRWKLNHLSWERSELFDLENDPGEFHNVIDDSGNAGIVKELTAIAKRLYSRS